MNIITAMAVMVYVTIWGIFHPSIFLKQERTLYSTNQVCTYTFSSTTPTIWKTEEIISFPQDLEFLTVECTPKKSTFTQQLQWEWNWQNDNQWKDENKSIYPF